MPVNYAATPAITHVPLRGEILVPSPVVFGIGGTGCCARSPNGRISGLQRAVGNDRNCPAQSIDADIAAPDICQILGCHARFQARHALQPGIGPDPVQAEQQPRRSGAGSDGSAAEGDPEILGQRREPVEHPFGSVKRWMNQGAFLIRGLEKVRAEFSLTALAYNMTRVLTIVGIERLAAALGHE